MNDVGYDPAWDRLVRRSVRSVTRYVSDDLMQVGRIAVWRFLRSHEDASDALLSVVVKRRAIDHIRRETSRGLRVVVPVSPVTFGSTVAAAFDDQVDHRLDAPAAVADVLHRCSTAQRRVLVAMLAYPDDTHRDIARRLGVSEQLISHVLNRCRKRLVAA